MTGHAVDYPASFATDSKTLGIASAVKYIKEQAAKCPNQKFGLVGYSQGADIMHGVGSQLPASFYPSIVAITLFGDPGNRGPNVKSPLGGIVPPFPELLALKVKENCIKGDPVCTNSGTVVGDHLAYSDPDKDYIKTSAEYIVQQFKADGKVGPQPSQWGGVQDKGNNTVALLELGKLLGAAGNELASLANA
jgi:Cutinase